MSRRSLIYGATLVGGMSISGLLSACSWVTSEPATPGLTPVETPADAPSPETPVPDTTPDPDTTLEPTPTLTPEPVARVLRVGGSLGEVRRAISNPDVDCLQLPATRAGLVEVNGNLEIEADWAEVWAPNDVGETWMFQTRQNDHGWTSGAPLTAHDFVSAWSRMLDPERQDPDAWRLFDILNARDVYNGERAPEELGLAAPDDWSLDVTLERPRYSFPALAASSMLIPEAGSTGDAPTGCDSNGPYAVTGEGEDAITLAPHDGYWSIDASSPERIELNTEGPARALDYFRRGELEVVRLAPADVPRVRNDSALRPYLSPAVPTRLACLVPQVDSPPFDDVNVRRALGLLIDRERLELIVEGRVIPARRLVAEGLFSTLDGVSSDLNVALDVDAGLELIENSTYPDPAEWPEFGLVLPQGDSYMERVARDLSVQLEENLGIVVPVELVRMEEYAEGVRQHRYPLTWVEWTYRYADPACAYADLFASWLNPERPSVWEDDEYDDLVRLADALIEPGERSEIYAQCEALLQELGVYTPLVHPVDHYLLQPWVEDVPRDTRGRIIQSGPFYTRFLTELSVSQRS